MVACVPCFVLPLLLFLFHRYIQPVLLRFWNPWKKPQTAPANCEFSCDCAWKKPIRKAEAVAPNQDVQERKDQ